MRFSVVPFWFVRGVGAAGKAHLTFNQEITGSSPVRPTGRWMIDLKWVQDQLRLIEATAYDDESAHGHEDEMYVSVLEAVAAGHPQSALLAAEALKAYEMDFCRWYA